MRSAAVPVFDRLHVFPASLISTSTHILIVARHSEQPSPICCPPAGLCGVLGCFFVQITYPLSGQGHSMHFLQLDHCHGPAISPSGRNITLSSLAFAFVSFDSAQSPPLTLCETWLQVAARWKQNGHPPSNQIQRASQGRARPLPGRSERAPVIFLTTSRTFFVFAFDDSDFRLCSPPAWLSEIVHPSRHTLHTRIHRPLFARSS